MRPHVVVIAEPMGGELSAGGPRTLEPLLFRPMIHYALDAAAALDPETLSVVVGQAETLFRERCADYPGLLFFRHDVQEGSGPAVQTLASFLTGRTGTLVVLTGDAPLLRTQTVRDLIERHVAASAACTLSASNAALGGLPAVFEIQPLFDALRRVAPANLLGERRLADAADLIERGGMKVQRLDAADAAEALPVRDLEALVSAQAVLRRRVNRELLRRGVRLEDPDTTLVDPRCAIEAGVVIEAYCRLSQCEIGAGTRVRQGSCVEGSRIGRDCVIGPYARVRPGSRLEDRVRAGNFVEIKNSRLGAGSKASHLSFIGDADIGRNVNIGCGFVTCNSDGGPAKQRTVVEDDVFIGSASQAVAPVRIGSGSFVATATTVTEDVPPDSFVISRGRQVTKAGYARKYRKAKGQARLAEKPGA